MEAATVRLLGMRDLTAIFGVTDRTIQNWVSDGYFPAPVRIGKRAKRWHPDVIDQFRSQQAAGSVQAAPVTSSQPEEQEAMEYFGVLRPNDDDDSLMTPAEACSSLHCSFGELFQAVEAGHLPVVVTENRHRRFKTGDVWRYQNDHMAEIVGRIKLERFGDRNPDLAEAE